MNNVCSVIQPSDILGCDTSNMRCVPIVNDDGMQIGVIIEELCFLPDDYDCGEFGYTTYYNQVEEIYFNEVEQ